MFNDAQVPEMAQSYCRTCMAPHDDEIHAATLSVRQWFRFEVTKYLCDDSDELYLIDETPDSLELVA